jgi:hypothetical protein
MERKVSLIARLAVGKSFSTGISPPNNEQTQSSSFLEAGNGSFGESFETRRFVRGSERVDYSPGYYSRTSEFDYSDLQF